ncbi:MAG: hypothetical protein A2Y95_08290 [Deltaproteobacteria bacterium RBG_13_65_10]|nr:MAG: hypothetical protein A2Y95_08290 [Deltaproteobacteria bacterium RBG_13_65_10]
MSGKKMDVIVAVAEGGELDGERAQTPQEVGIKARITWALRGVLRRCGDESRSLGRVGRPFDSVLAGEHRHEMRLELAWQRLHLIEEDGSTGRLRHKPRATRKTREGVLIRKSEQLAL